MDRPGRAQTLGGHCGHPDVVPTMRSPPASDSEALEETAAVGNTPAVVCERREAEVGVIAGRAPLTR
jgi:hypothetical protein